MKCPYCGKSISGFLKELDGVIELLYLFSLSIDSQSKLWDNYFITSKYEKERKKKFRPLAISVIETIRGSTQTANKEEV